VNINKNQSKIDTITTIVTPPPPPAPEPTQPTGEVIALSDGENLVSTETPTEASSTMSSYEEGDDILKKKYTAGKYRTVVIVYEGKVVVNPYDEEGIKENEGVALTAGQKATHEEEVK
jgi:hypothetical protein